MVDQELNDLRREFLVEAREKVIEMQSAVSGGQTPDSGERLVYLAHQLKGSGGSYGFPAISDRAAEIEKAAEGAPGDEAIPALREHVSALLAEVDRCLRSLG